MCSGYDATTFALKIKMPSVVLLREYSLLQHLRRAIPSFHTRTPFDHKEVLKVRLKLYDYCAIHPSKL